MKSESEKKSIVKSIKLSPSQVQQIEEKANEKNMTFSSYMVLSNQFHTEYHRVTLSHTKKSDSMGLFNGRKLKNSETALF